MTAAANLLTQQQQAQCEFDGTAAAIHLLSILASHHEPEHYRTEAQRVEAAIQVLEAFAAVFQPTLEDAIKSAHAWRTPLEEKLFPLILMRRSRLLEAALNPFSGKTFDGQGMWGKNGLFSKAAQQAALHATPQGVAA